LKRRAGLGDRGLDDSLEQERAYHNALYGQMDRLPRDTGWTFREAITPAFLPGGSTGGLTHLRAHEILEAEGVEGKQLLDYACGMGKWAVHFAQLGARVTGFDLSDVAIKHARARARENGVSARFDRANAAELPYEAESFDLVVGIGALHHVAKYPGTSAELYRVMRPNALAVFTENFGQNPVLELGRRVTLRSKHGAGDLILTETMIHDWASDFRAVRIEPYSLLFMLKRIVPGNRRFLGLLHRLDEDLFRLAPGLRRYCGECVVVLRR
jgi:ubiquinone/menaquinone biosynthesis C-methylase UbiE